MQAIISSRHFRLYQETKQEFLNCLKDFNNDKWKLNKVEVVLNRAHNQFHVEILISGKNLNLESKAESGNLYNSFYKAYERSMKQLRKTFEKRRSHKTLHLADLEILAEEFSYHEQYKEIPA